MNYNNKGLTEVPLWQMIIIIVVLGQVITENWLICVYYKKGNRTLSF